MHPSLHASELAWGTTSAPPLLRTPRPRLHPSLHGHNLHGHSLHGHSLHGHNCAATASELAWGTTSAQAPAAEDTAAAAEDTAADAEDTAPATNGSDPFGLNDYGVLETTQQQDAFLSYTPATSMPEPSEPEPAASEAPDPRIAWRQANNDSLLKRDTEEAEKKKADAATAAAFLSKTEKDRAARVAAKKKASSMQHVALSHAACGTISMRRVASSTISRMQ
jgi:hypothetical protein